MRYAVCCGVDERKAPTPTTNADCDLHLLSDNSQQFIWAAADARAKTYVTAKHAGVKNQRKKYKSDMSESHTI